LIFIIELCPHCSVVFEEALAWACSATLKTPEALGVPNRNERRQAVVKKGDFSEAIRLDPNNTAYRRARAQAWQVNGDQERAIADLPRSTDSYRTRRSRSLSC
jgi:hypothetical protein